MNNFLTDSFHNFYIFNRQHPPLRESHQGCPRAGWKARQAQAHHG